MLSGKAKLIRWTENTRKETERQRERGINKPLANKLVKCITGLSCKESIGKILVLPCLVFLDFLFISPYFSEFFKKGIMLKECNILQVIMSVMISLHLLLRFTEKYSLENA